MFIKYVEMVMESITEWVLPVPDPTEFWKEFGSDSPTVVSEVPHAEELNRLITNIIMFVCFININYFIYWQKVKHPSNCSYIHYFESVWNINNCLEIPLHVFSNSWFEWLHSFCLQVPIYFNNKMISLMFMQDRR